MSGATVTPGQRYARDMRLREAARMALVEAFEPGKVADLAVVAATQVVVSADMLDVVASLAPQIPAQNRRALVELVLREAGMEVIR